MFQFWRKGRGDFARFLKSFEPFASASYYPFYRQGIVSILAQKLEHSPFYTYFLKDIYNNNNLKS